jgi:hypothetical protein
VLIWLSVPSHISPQASEVALGASASWIQKRSRTEVRNLTTGPTFICIPAGNAGDTSTVSHAAAGSANTT